MEYFMSLSRPLFAVTIVALAGCGELTPSQPIVSDYNGDSVRIQQMNILGEGFRSEVTDAEATRICQRGGRQTAEYASYRALPDGNVEHLYLCI
jgi:hypothetical protein